MSRIWSFLTEYSLLLVFGAVTALVWANIDLASYRQFVSFIIWENAPIGHPHAGQRTLSVHYLVNDVLMTFFFAIAAKEVWEAMVLKDGPLHGKKAATPLLATLGGMLGPIVIYLGLASIMGSTTFDAVAHGWAIPTATDIAFSYLVGRVVFGRGHPAVKFLLLLAIADDAAGLIILTLFYPTTALALEWLAMSIGAAVLVFVLANWLPRRLDRGKQDRPNSTWMRIKLGYWPYVIAGGFSWYGFMLAGLHPALGLLPIVPTIPHSDRAFGISTGTAPNLTDLLNQISNALKLPVEVILFFFGLTNAGVPIGAVAEATWLVMAGLVVGKPLGIFAMGWLAARPLGLGLAKGLRIRDLAVIGCVAAIGFTVSIFFASAAFDPGPVQDAAKMGALFSFVAAGVALVAAPIAGVKRVTH